MTTVSLLKCEDYTGAMLEDAIREGLAGIGLDPGIFRGKRVVLDRRGRDAKRLRLFEHAAREKVEVDARQHVTNSNAACNPMLWYGREQGLDVLHMSGRARRENTADTISDRVAHRVLIPSVADSQADSFTGRELRAELKRPLVFKYRTEQSRFRVGLVDRISCQEKTSIHETRI